MPLVGANQGMSSTKDRAHPANHRRTTARRPSLLPGRRPRLGAAICFAIIAGMRLFADSVAHFENASRVAPNITPPQVTVEVLISTDPPGTHRAIQPNAQLLDALTSRPARGEVPFIAQ